MKLLCCTLLLFMASGLSFGLEVVNTHPRPNSEDFAPSDTLRITFDGVPDQVEASDILIQGTNACYPVSALAVDGNSLLVFPAHYWLVGDKVVVTVRSTAITSPYSFQFTVAVLRGSLSGVWALRELLAPGHVPLATTAMDMDGDGPVDVGILYSDALGVARNIIYDDPCGPTCIPFDGDVGLLTPAPGFSNGPRVLRAADLDGDHRPELVASNFGSNTLVIYQNVSLPGFIIFGDTSHVVLDVTSPRDFRLVDINADGRIDIIVIGQSADPVHDELQVFLNNEDPGYHFPVQEIETGSGPTMLGQGDFTVDGRLDLVVSCVNQRALNRLQVSAFNPLSFAVDTLFNGLPSGPDGVLADNVYWDIGIAQRPDLVVWSRGAHTLDETAYIWRYRNIGGIFASPDSIAGLTYIPHSVTLVDLNATTGNSTSHEWIVIGDSGGVTNTWCYDSALQPLEVGFNTPPVRPLSCMSFDADLDGDMDLFFVDATSDDAGRVLYERNPDGAGVQPGAFDFGVVPNRCTDLETFHFRNEGYYPATICNIVMQGGSGVFELSSPTDFPFSVGPLDSQAVVFSYTPCYSGADSGTARISFYGGIGGCRQQLVSLYGQDGQPQIVVVPDTIIDFGYVEQGSSILDSFQIVNVGTWNLVGHYNTSTLQNFAYLGPIDEVVAPNDYSPWHRVRFTAPPDSPDTTFLERMRLSDSTTCFSCPAQPSQDSKWIYFRQQVITNVAPQFTFPTVFLNEGESGILTCTVHDSNAVGPRYRVTSRLQTMNPPYHPLTITDTSVYEWQWQDTIRVPFHAADSINGLSEFVTLSFAAIDTPFGGVIDSSWTIQIYAIDDPARFVSWHDITVWEGTNIVDSLLATVADEENDSLIGRWEWLGPVPVNAVIHPPLIENTFTLDWQTTYTDSGTYPVQLKVFAYGDSTRFETVVVTIRVIDRPPNLQANVLVTPDTTTRNSTVFVHWEVRETNSIPVLEPFVAHLSQTAPGGGTIFLTDTTFLSLPAGGMFSETRVSASLNACDNHTFTLALNLSSPDGNGADNLASTQVHVICPDLAVYLAQVPDTVERGEPFAVNYEVHEEHGVTVQGGFRVVIADEHTDDTLLVRHYSGGLGANGVLTGSASYASTLCGFHTIAATIIPPTDYEDDPSNNSVVISMRVWCPDLAALSVTAPPQMHKNESFPIHFTLGEVNGISVDTPFTASIVIAGVRTDFHFDGIASDDTIDVITNSVGTRMGPLPILLRVYPPPGHDENPLNDTLSTVVDILADPFNAYPLPFTPNGDRFNDTLHFNFGDEQFRAPVVKIFTIDGRLVRTLDDVNYDTIDWDGRDKNGSECAPGPYLYTFDDGGTKISSGIIYVAR